MDWLPIAITIIFHIISSTTAICPEGDGCGPCQIYPNQEYEIHCGITATSSNFLIKYRPEEYILITCIKSPDWSEFHLGSRQSVPRVKTVYFRMCQLPEGNQLGAIVKQLFSETVDELDFRSFNDITSSLSRKTLEGFENITSLTLSSNSLSNISVDLVKGLSNLTLLNLRENNIRELPKDFFNIPSLLNLELGSNHLKIIEADAFDKLSSLRLLNIWDNKLIEIKPHAFDKLVSLKSLDLHQNNLSKLPNDLFVNLKQLKVINLGQNNFTIDSFSGDLLRPVSSLQTFTMKYNKRNVTTLPSGFFSNLKNLTMVQLSRNGLIYVPEDLFWGKNNLTHLNMARNYLQTIPPGFFKDCQKLKILDLSFNEITFLPDEIFSTLTSLEELDLSINHITTVSEKLLTGLVSLQVLKMERNGMTTIDAHAFRSLENLRIAKFSHNNLTLGSDLSYFVDIFGTNSPFHFCTLALEELHLAHNQISEVYQDFRFATQLKILNLAHNQLHSLSVSDLDFLSKNAKIDMTYNRIRNIYLNGIEMLAQEQSFPRNVRIDIENNPLSCDCNIYDLLRYLEGDMHTYVQNLFFLNIGNLKCNEPEWTKGIEIRHFKSKTLTCGFTSEVESNATCPEKCSCSLRPSDRAYLIDCSYAGLTQAPAPFINPLGPNSPVELNLTGNHLVSMTPFNQTGYNQVTVLALANNNLTTIHPEWLSKELTYLDLEGNKLQKLDTKVLEFWKDSKLIELKLQRNNWICDCEAREFLNFIQKMRVNIPGLQKVTCFETNANIFEMTPEELCPIVQDWIIGLSIGVALLGIILGAIAALYYRYQHEIKVWLYAHQWCLWFVTEDELDKDKLYDAFISFSQKDESFITKELVPKLESGPNAFKLCVHYRDWKAGEWIPRQIARSIEDSRRTIVVVSPNFLESVWGRLEFRAAHSQALKEGRARVIIILYGDIGSTDDLDSELKAYLNMNTYVRWGDPWFWEKLRYALPHATDCIKKKKKKVTNIFENQHPTIQINTDKSELIEANGISTISPLTSTPPADTIKSFIKVEDETKIDGTTPYRITSNV